MNHKWNYQPITPEQAETSQTLAQSDKQLVFIFAAIA